MDLHSIIKVIFGKLYHRKYDVHSGEKLLNFRDILLPPFLRLSIITELHSQCTCHFQILPSKLVSETLWTS